MIPEEETHRAGPVLDETHPSMPKRDAIIGRILALSPSWQHSELQDFEFLSGGFSNLNIAFNRVHQHKTESYVLRIAGIPQPFVDRHHEDIWYQNLPEPPGIRPLALNRATGDMLSKRLSGEVLADVFSTRFNPEDLLHFTAGLHKALPDSGRAFCLADLLGDYGVAPDPRLTPVEAKHSTTCHNDLNPWNILVTPEGWVTLDWEFVGSNDPLFDLVTLCLGLDLPQEDLASLSEAFLGGRDMPRLKRNVLAFWKREWAWASFQIARGNERAEIRDQLLTSADRLQRLG